MEHSEWMPDAASPLRPELHGPSGALPAEPWPDGVRGRAHTARSGYAERGATDLPARVGGPLPGRRGPGRQRRGRGASRVGPYGPDVRQRVARVIEARGPHHVARVRRV